MAGKTNSPSTLPAADQAADSEGTAKKRGRGPGRPFVPGQSGNPGGRPKDVLGVQRLALQHCAAAIEKLVALMEKAKSERAQAAAAVAILDRGCGKPTQPPEGQHNVVWHVSDKPMSIDEWRKRYT